MDLKAKLVELIDEVQDEGCEYSNCHSQWDRPEHIDNSVLAEHLIANGVRLEDKQATSNGWISVKDRLPEDGEIVLVCGSRGGVYTAVFNKPGQYRGWHKLNSKSHYCDPTHWMPLPQPPKGD